MSTAFSLRIASIFFAAWLPTIVANAVQADKENSLRLDAADKIEKALQASELQDDPERQITILKSVSAETLRTMGVNVFVADALGKVQQTKITDPRKLAKEWRTALIEARDILRFQPLVEAPLPEGFPRPTPVGEIRVQTYPKYRLAKTDMTLIEGRAFWTLFNHIKQKEIAMTAPVEMTYSTEGNGAAKKSAMSFLYRSTDQGQLGVEGKVEVIDVPPLTAVSIGLRGDATKDRVADAKRRLDTWLQVHGDEYESSGALRILGYNSPFVSDQQRFTEVQIPVRSKRRD